MQQAYSQNYLLRVLLRCLVDAKTATVTKNTAAIDRYVQATWDIQSANFRGYVPTQQCIVNVEICQLPEHAPFLGDRPCKRIVEQP